MATMPSLLNTRIKRIYHLSDEFFDQGDLECTARRKAIAVIDEPSTVPSGPATNAKSIGWHRCSECKRFFPTSRWLEIHFRESHDTFFKVQAEKQKMYECLVEGCVKKFSNSQMRRMHLTDAHMFPKDFQVEMSAHHHNRRKPKPGSHHETITEMASGQDENSSMSVEDSMSGVQASPQGKESVFHFGKHRGQKAFSRQDTVAQARGLHTGATKPQSEGKKKGYRSKAGVGSGVNTSGTTDSAVSGMDGVIEHMDSVEQQSQSVYASTTSVPVPVPAVRTPLNIAMIPPQLRRKNVDETLSQMEAENELMRHEISEIQGRKQLRSGEIRRLRQDISSLTQILLSTFAAPPDIQMMAEGSPTTARGFLKSAESFPISISSAQPDQPLSRSSSRNSVVSGSTTVIIKSTEDSHSLSNSFNEGSFLASVNSGPSYLNSPGESTLSPRLRSQSTPVRPQPRALFDEEAAIDRPLNLSALEVNNPEEPQQTKTKGDSPVSVITDVILSPSALESPSLVATTSPLRRSARLGQSTELVSILVDEGIKEVDDDIESGPHPPPPLPATSPPADMQFQHQLMSPPPPRTAAHVQQQQRQQQRIVASAPTSPAARQGHALGDSMRSPPSSRTIPEFRPVNIPVSQPASTQHISSTTNLSVLPLNAFTASTPSLNQQVLPSGRPATKSVHSGSSQPHTSPPMAPHSFPPPPQVVPNTQQQQQQQQVPLHQSQHSAQPPHQGKWSQPVVPLPRSASNPPGELGISQHHPHSPQIQLHHQQPATGSAPPHASTTTAPAPWQMYHDLWQQAVHAERHRQAEEHAQKLREESERKAALERRESVKKSIAQVILDADSLADGDRQYLMFLVREENKELIDNFPLYEAHPRHFIEFAKRVLYCVRIMTGQVVDV